MFTKILNIGIALVLFVSLLTTAMAAPEASALATGYGTLYGCIYDYGGYVTKVTQNPDYAVLTFYGVIKDNSTGATVLVEPTQYSSQGETTFVDRWDWWSASFGQTRTIAIFGAHGVQGGRTYQSAAVYTSLVYQLPPDKA